ncbi:Vacuolar protein sorting-associated protein 27 [Phytophthora cinnamomi]|uniref:Vacuolar protein sorting-associated protein 27 n=1 Tax=Phytophthora cinnamomi TaxID=4785 RepID=UPI0035598E80|nr:Vacuolar protein sorting-associated protein 27 [Phytophthora cinnamomi]
MKPKAAQDAAAKTALELAESSEWGALDRLISAQPERADDMDDFGMMPLHWACTDTHVPLRTVKKLVDVAPAALAHKNKGGLLPLHIAVKAATKLEVLRALVQAAPDVAACLFEETPTGETPAELARAYQLSDDKVFLDRGEYNSAVVEFRKSVDANRKDVDVWINLARALHGAGEFYDAEIAIRRALALTPKNYASLSMLGKILHSKGEHDKAVEVFREALSLMDQEDDSDEDVGSMTVGW